MRNTAIMATLGALLIAGCDTIPRDPAQTSERIAATGVIRLATIAGTRSDPAIERALEELSAETGARVQRVSGPGEALLEALEKGEFDLVYGRFADDSPWAARVHFGTPSGAPDSYPASERMPRFAFRPGENGWITTVEAAGE